MTPTKRQITADDVRWGSWRKPWGGHLSHFVMGGKETACGKSDMVFHDSYPYDVHEPARGRCAKCERIVESAQQPQKEV